MSKNYNLIATVDIDLESPIVDDSSFDNILIMGPAPAGENNAPDVGVYSNIGEVEAAGYVVSGENADPVGVAARVAFAQSPTPTAVYIAVQKRTSNSYIAEMTINDANTAIATYVGVKDTLTGCGITFNEDARKIIITLNAQPETVKGTGLFDMLANLNDQGYLVTIEGIVVDGINCAKTLPVWESIMSMMEGDEVSFQAFIGDEDNVGVTYTISVVWPRSDYKLSVQSSGGSPVDNPENEIESVTDTISRAIATDGWYVLCTAGIAADQYETIAAYIETQEKMFAYTELGFFGVGKDGENESTVSNVYFRTKGIYGRTSTSQADDDIPEANLYLNVASVVKWLNYESGSETAAFKVLSSVEPSKLTSNEIKALKEANLDFFTTVGSKNMTMNGKVIGGEWADVIRFRDWLKNDMQVRVVNLFVTNPKIPYTDAGISLVQNQMLASLKAGLDAGGIAEDEYDEDGNVIPGYTTSVPLASDLSASEKASRTLRNCKFKARLAGAIHFAELTGSLTYEL